MGELTRGREKSSSKGAPKRSSGTNNSIVPTEYDNRENNEVGGISVWSQNIRSWKCFCGNLALLHAIKSGVVERQGGDRTKLFSSHTGITWLAADNLFGW